LGNVTVNGNALGNVMITGNVLGNVMINGNVLIMWWSTATPWVSDGQRQRLGSLISVQGNVM
jgi:hypothetical protein